MYRTILRTVCFCLLAFPVVTGMQVRNASADFPEKSINVILPFAPGGGTDILTRVFDMFAKEVFGHNFVVVYKPGAGSAVGTTSIAREKNDGYTIGMGSLPHMFLQPASGSGRYTLNDFDYIALVASEPQLLVTPKDSPYKNFEQFSEAVHKAPGKLSLGIPSPLSEAWLAWQIIAKANKLDCTVITYQGGNDLNAALMGKHVDAATTNISPVFSEIHNLNVLGVTASQRVKLLPDTPTFKEQGVNLEYETAVERVFMAPKGVDPAKLKTLREGFKKIWYNPAFQKRVQEMRIGMKWIDGENVRAYLDKMSVPVLAVYQEFAKKQK